MRKEQEPTERDVPPVKGDPDFEGVARERVSGPADYDESAGNELQTNSPRREEDTSTTDDASS